MLKRTFALCLLSVVGLSLTGCTHTQLRNNTVKQSETVSDIYQQQVLDNLAMFAYDAQSLPFFAFPDQGTNQVTDNASASFGQQWLKDPFWMLGLGADRTLQQTWTMEPVRDPHKLQLMRCAYQHAVATCLGGEVVSRDCPKCDTILDEFYGDPAHEGGVNKSCVLNWKEDHGWFGMGGKKDVPKDCGCVLVGEYCGQYVWVLPGCRDKLSQLTLAILDYAVFESAESEKKLVVVTIERDANDKIVKTTRQETYQEDVKDKKGHVIYRRGVRSTIGGSGLLRLQQRLNTVRSPR